MNRVSPVISIITPTKNRAAMLPTIAQCVLSQTLAWEWWVYDDSAEPSTFMQQLAQSDARVHYLYDPTSVTIGHKRNVMLDRAVGQYIVHFDDDDYYSPKYAHDMVMLLEKGQADLIKLSGFYIYAPASRFFGYMDLTAKTGLHYQLIGGEVSTVEFHEKKQIGADFIVFYGFSYVYRRQVGQAIRFQDINLYEDEHFVKSLLNQGYRMVTVADDERDCVHTVHPQSTSRCFSKYHIPEFLLLSLFPTYAQYQWLFDR